jgi:hypothetical protein
MLFPSTSILVLSAVLFSLLIAADWFVWGAAQASRQRLPKQAAPAKVAAADQDENENAGFKHVA